MNAENVKSQMRKGTLEYCILSLIFQRCNAGNELFVRRGGVVKALKRERQRLSPHH